MARVKASNSCETVDLVSAYLDGQLQPGELDIVVDHLAECVQCIAEFHQLKEIRAALRTLPYLEIPDRLLPDTHPGEQLSAYLDGQLDTIEHDFVVTHLGFCTDCRLELHELDGARTAIRSLPGLDPPEFLEAHRERIENQRWTRRRVMTAGAGIAAAAAILVATFGPTTDPGGDLDINPLFDQHQARTSVEPGLSVVPGFYSASFTP
ncbi:MAG: zf-HC2 domain-containing protein [Acidimicrobiia bacterium]|nr:zf-HC2 domain-containing protein [Acidimicrobiia bacterium]MDX2467598.1 zf-HC2 domain-containing protein [Acidimicrobiia bacterium]